ncbi:hypothetical protein O6H91_15G029000 [Diphasiastrum complanatum]|uniref:Uncharacterized protein n=1 Tax=Diphasiastrum complanatum TaxID=34168 RepID=A0ACC2BGX6_DIPCM|nr:hypothetical protein O6H91_15G029000 [Diphasiastrum complanatum]
MDISITVLLLFSSCYTLPRNFLRVFSLALLSAVSQNLGDVCQTDCGGLSVQYPFSIIDGCGSPNYKLACVQNELQLQHSTYTYQISDIDYDSSTLFLKDFSDSAASCTYLRNLRSTGIYVLNVHNFILCGNSNAGNITSVIPYLCRSDIVSANFSCALDTFYSCSSDPIHCCANAIPDSEFSNFTCGPYGQASNTNLSNMTTGPPSLSGLLNGYKLLELDYESPPHQVNCTDCIKSNGSCGYSSSSSFLCLCGSTNSSTKCPDCISGSCSKILDDTVHHRKNDASLIIGLSVGGTIVILGLSGVFLLLLKRRTIGNRRYAIGRFNSSSEKDKELMQKLNLKETTLFLYRELEMATDSFSETRKLGTGAFSTVYKGNLKDGQIVAVKKLNRCNKYGLNQLYSEVTILSKVRHRNLVQLLGFCLDGSELLLVYEFVPNGTLAGHLHGDRGKGLNWATRLRIAVETARALAYLHESVCPSILHRDVKATNILLDESFHAKVADFGLSKFVPLEVTHISTAPQGTPGYLDPDYQKSYRLTDKSDVYSFGVVLMEMISAKKAVDMSREMNEINLASFAIAKILCGALHEVVDPNLEIQSMPEVKDMVTSVAQLALCCLSSKKDSRPGMKKVAEKLEQILQQGYAGVSYGTEPKEDITEATKEVPENLDQIIQPAYGPFDLHIPTGIQLQWELGLYRDSPRASI